MRYLVLLGLLAFSLNAAQATGVYSCKQVDKSEWMTSDQLAEKLKGEGWEVRFMKEDGGCWEVYGTNPEGKRVEAYFHPKTGEPRYISQRGTVLFKAID
ncbi:MAG: PepSY domain-containing protein [Hyphomicrobiales bacterium]